MNNQNLCILILVIACVICLLALLYRIKKEGLRATVIELILQAEKMLGSGKGEEKMNFVIDSFIKFIPSPFNLLLTRENIKIFIQKIFDEIKEALEYGNK